MLLRVVAVAKKISGCCRNAFRADTSRIAVGPASHPGVTMHCLPTAAIPRTVAPPSVPVPGVHVNVETTRVLPRVINRGSIAYARKPKSGDPTYSSCVDRSRRSTGLPAPPTELPEELVGSERVGLLVDALPSPRRPQIPSRGALLSGADPVVCRERIVVALQVPP